MSYRGMDPGVITQVADGMAQQASSLESVTAHVDSLLQQVSVLWPGQDAEDFHQFWLGQHRPRLQSTVDGLRTAVTGLRAQVQAQVDVSGGTTLVIKPSPSPADASPPGDDWFHRLTADLREDTLKDFREPILAMTDVGAVGLWARTLRWSDEEYLEKAVKNSGWFTASRRLAAVHDFASGDGWGGMFEHAGARLSSRFSEGALADVAAGINKSAKVVGPLGRALPAVDVVVGGLTAVDELRRGDTTRGAIDVLGTGITAAAFVTPPPADVVLGGLSVGIAAGELIYDHWDDISRAGDVAVDGLAHAGSTLVDGTEQVGSIARGVVHDATQLLPW